MVTKLPVLTTDAVILAAYIFPEELILVPSKEIFNDWPIPSCNWVIVPVDNALLVPKCANDW